MFHRKLERQQPGKPIAARTLNRIMDLLERIANLRVSPPLAMMDSTGGPLLYLANYVDFAWGNTGSGFTAATGTPPVPTSQTITLYDVTPGSPPVFTNRSPTVTAWNPYKASGGIAASKTAFFGKTLDGTWWVITADC